MPPSLAVLTERSPIKRAGYVAAAVAGSPSARTADGVREPDDGHVILPPPGPPPATTRGQLRRFRTWPMGRCRCQW